MVIQIDSVLMLINVSINVVLDKADSEKNFSAFYEQWLNGRYSGYYEFLSCHYCPVRKFAGCSVLSPMIIFDYLNFAVLGHSIFLHA